MNEHQNVEWKSRWRDEYLKWICGFANAQGGKIYIGTDNAGNIVGINNAKRLLEDIPNKIQTTLGIIADVNLLTKDGKEYIEIIVPPYSNAINYKGEYHYRSGSTKQELKGDALNKFLQEKSGICWEALPVDDVEIADLSEFAFQRFRDESFKNNRSAPDILTDSREHILQNLRLIDKKTGKLTKAAILLFHPEPDKYIVGAYLKIAFFRNDDEELLFFDDVRGSIMEQIEKTKDLLDTKYAYPTVSFEGWSRIEKSPFPAEAIRESLLNCLAHKEYQDVNPIQISVYPDHIVFWNPGSLPDSITPEMLLTKHPSVLRNPLIASTLFRSGDIDMWGRGYKRIMKAVNARKMLPPIIKQMAGLMVTYYNDIRTQITTMSIDERLIPIIEYIVEKGSVTNSEVQDILNVSKPTAYRLLKQLNDIVEKQGATGKGTFYVLRGAYKC